MGCHTRKPPVAPNYFASSPPPARSRYHAATPAQALHGGLYRLRPVPDRFTILPRWCKTMNRSPNPPTRLRCESFDNPLAIDAARPRLSWLVNDDRRNAVQAAYHVQVASSPQKIADDTADLWDSGKVASDQSVHVEYGGAPLISRQTCVWRVRTWDANGDASPWSDVATWEMGLLD